MEPVLREVLIEDDPEAWAALGFTVRDDAIALGSVTLRLGPGFGAIAGCAVDGLEPGEIDGLRFTAAGEPAPAEPHPNGAVALDHVVAVTDDLPRTCAALAAHAGLVPRRERHEGDAHQAFFVLKTALLEVAQAEGRTRYWGVVVVVEDLDHAALVIGDRLEDARDAVQPGRRIATVRREAGLGIPLAFMSPRG